MAKNVVVDSEAVKRAGRRSTKASALLAGREVPVGHERSLAVQQFIDEQRCPNAVRTERRMEAGCD